MIAYEIVRMRAGRCEVIERVLLRECVEVVIRWPGWLDCWIAGARELVVIKCYVGAFTVFLLWLLCVFRENLFQRQRIEPLK